MFQNKIIEVQLNFRYYGSCALPTSGYSQLLYLTICIKKNSVQPSLYVAKRWQLNFKTKRSLGCLPAKATRQIMMQLLSVDQTKFDSVKLIFVIEQGSCTFIKNDCMCLVKPPIIAIGTALEISYQTVKAIILIKRTIILMNRQYSIISFQ